MKEYFIKNKIEYYLQSGRAQKAYYSITARTTK